MNRSSPTDSKLSLDRAAETREPATVIKQPYQIYIERSDRQKNMARFYAMAIEPTLFGEISLTRRWGRIGSRGQVLIQHFGNERDAVETFLHLTRRKRQRGYRPRPL
jgi:predicted DNA-binding WGR domain protein